MDIHDKNATKFTTKWSLLTISLILTHQKVFYLKKMLKFRTGRNDGRIFGGTEYSVEEKTEYSVPDGG